jgi:uncharacterized protein YjbI with pentapeptide repeats
VTGAKGSGLAWFVRRGSAVLGPYSSAQVRHLVLEGRLELADAVSPDRVRWSHLGSVPEVIPLQMRVSDDAWASAQATQCKGERLGALRAILAASLVAITLTAAVSLIGMNETTPERDCAATPVPEVFLEGCQLSGVKLRGAALNNARMANAVLARAELAEAELSNADLRYADLAGADLSYARLDSANLKGANLRFADLTNVDLSAADLRFADLSGARLGGARLDRAVLNGAIWSDGRPCLVPDCPR